MTPNPDGLHTWENLVAWIGERTGLDRQMIKCVLEAQNDFWRARPDLTRAILQDRLDGMAR